MQKIVINKETLKVMQVINLDIDSTWSDDWYINDIVVDDTENKINGHGYIYAPETGEFIEIDGYKEPVAEIEENPMVKVINELQSQVAEVVDEKYAALEMCILELAEIIGGEM